MSDGNPRFDAPDEEIVRFALHRLSKYGPVVHVPLTLTVCEDHPQVATVDLVKRVVIERRRMTKLEY